MTAVDVATKPSVKALLERTAKLENIADPRYDVTFTMKKGDGFMSVIYDAIVRDGAEEVLSVIVKMSPENKILREQSQIRTLYAHEVLMYNEIYPAFRQFQLDNGVEEVFEFAPKCYATSMEDGDEGLVLDNLRVKGFRVWNRMVPMDEKHIEMAVKGYAKFHALSLAFRDQRKSKFEEFRSKTTDIYAKFASNPMHKEVYERMVESTVGFLDPVEDKIYVEKFRKHLETIEKEREIFYSKNMDEYSVIGHGDCWCNNLMFKYDDPNAPTNPVGFTLLDFQIIRYTSPIMDFTHFFYTSSPKSIQDNIEHYLGLYYNTLRSFVRQLGSDPEKVYPKSIFDAHWKKYCINGLYVAIFMIKIMSSESEEVPDFNATKDNESMMSAMEYEPKDTGYKKRVRDIILHFCEKGFI